MSKTMKKTILLALVVLVFISFAMYIRYASRTYLNHPGWGYLRSAIYISLFFMWGLSLHIRIVQTQVRHYLFLISMLMVLWLILRSIKFSIDSLYVSHWLWYFYYIPILFIPMLSVFVAKSLGKSEDFRLPKWTKLLYIPTTIMLLLVLTNDSHQLVFYFPNNILSDDEYRYGIGYLFVLSWELLCAAVSLVLMIKNCRIPHSKKFRFLPLVPFILSLIYVHAYAKKVYWVWVLAGDMTVSQCLIFASIFECCIQCGLIQSNMGYGELFEVTSLPIQITDNSLCTKHISGTMQRAFTQNKLHYMQKDTIRLDEDTLLKRHKIRQGWVFWKEDISELNKINKELEITHDELRDIGDVLAAENAQRAKLLKLTEANRLYDIMESQTANQIAMLQELLIKLQHTDDREQAERILSKVIILGTYIKRRNNLIFVGVQRGSISVQELRLCFNESVENLSLYGVDCSVHINGDRQLTVDQAAQVYDLFEAVVEAEFDSLHALLIFVDVGEQVEVNLCVSGAQSLCNLNTQFPGLEWEQDDDGLQYIMHKSEKLRGL